MSKAKSIPARPVFVTPSSIVWTDERLAALDATQLGNLLDNLPIQVAAGRVSEEVAADLEARIESRLPARQVKLRRKRREESGSADRSE
jgi:hypothetical protein